jgi:hypothetical protein
VNESKISRRKWLEYAGGAALAVGAGLVAYQSRDKWLPYVMPGPSPTPTPTATTHGPTAENNPPYADFEIVRPKYIYPTVEQEVHLRSNSKDEDGDPLINRLYVNDVLELETDSEDLRFKFKEAGTNRVKLEVSDGKLTNERELYLEVEPSEMYPINPLDVKYKGIIYFAGPMPDWRYIRPPQKDKMEDELDTIRNELGCNAIRITGDGSAGDNLIECGKIAIEKGFDRVYINPRYLGQNLESTHKKIVEFAPEVKSLREMSTAVVYMFGSEISIEQTGMVEGPNWFARMASISKYLNRIQSKLRPFINNVISALEDSYGYELAYASGQWEHELGLVPWENTAFESVMSNVYLQEYYGWTEQWAMNFLQGMKRYGKPVHTSEFGCFSYVGAGKYGGAGSIYMDNKPEDQKEQADYIIKFCNMLNRVKIAGCQYVMWDDPYPQSTGLINGKKRKLGFYALKSFKIKT